MKLLSFLVAFLVIPSYGIAGEFDEQINKACLRHAVSLVAKLKTNVVDNMSSEQSDEALIIATESCQAYFKNEFNRNPDAVTAARQEQQERDDKKDWFTEMMTSGGGDAAEKDGNKRLRRKN